MSVLGRTIICVTSMTRIAASCVLDVHTKNSLYLSKIEPDSPWCVLVQDSYLPTLK